VAGRAASSGKPPPAARAPCRHALGRGLGTDTHPQKGAPDRRTVRRSECAQDGTVKALAVCPRGCGGKEPAPAASGERIVRGRVFLSLGDQCLLCPGPGRLPGERWRGGWPCQAEYHVPHFQDRLVELGDGAVESRCGRAITGHHEREMQIQAGAEQPSGDRLAGRSTVTVVPGVLCPGPYPGEERRRVQVAPIGLLSLCHNASLRFLRSR
jgi:hypothetical protein